LDHKGVATVGRGTAQLRNVVMRSVKFEDVIYWESCYYTFERWNSKSGYLK